MVAPSCMETSEAELFSVATNHMAPFIFLVMVRTCKQGFDWLLGTKASQVLPRGCQSCTVIFRYLFL